MKHLLRVLSIVLVVVGAASAAVGSVLWWADQNVFDTDQVVARTGEVIADEDVQLLLAERIVERVMPFVGDEAFRPQVESIVAEAIADTDVQRFVTDGVRAAHLLLVRSDVEDIPLRLAALNEAIRVRIEADVPELAGRIPPTEDVLTFDLFDRSDLPAAWNLADRFNEAAAAFISIGVVLVGIALVIGPARWIRLALGGVTFAAIGFAAIVALRTAIAAIEAGITDPIAVAATKDIFDSFFSGLDQQAVVMVISGLLAALLGLAIRLMRPEYQRGRSQAWR